MNREAEWREFRRITQQLQDKVVHHICGYPHCRNLDHMILVDPKEHLEPKR